MRNSKAIKELAKEIKDMGSMLEQCDSANVEDYMLLIESIKNKTRMIEKKLSKLQNFNVSLKKMLSTQIDLTDKSFVKSNACSIIDKIGEVKYKYEGQYLEIQDILLKVLDDSLNDKEVKEYFASCSGKENTKEYIISGINRLFEVLNDARKSEDKAKRAEFENVLKAYGVIAKVLQKSDMAPIEKIIRLTMIANASENCSSAWKETLLVLLTSLEEHLDVQLKDLLKEDIEKDALTKSIEQIFICARVKVAEDLGNKLIEQEGVEIEYRPHWMDICKNTLNEEFNFNLADIRVKDIYTSLADKLRIKCKFLEAIKYYNLNDLVYDKACEIFYDEICVNSSIKNDKSLKENYKKIKENGSLSGLVIDWARRYIDKNNLSEEEPDIIDFMYKYIMNANNNDRIRYIAIKEIMKDCGFIKEKDMYDNVWYHNPTVLITRINRALEDIATEKDKQAFLNLLFDITEKVEDIEFNFTSDNFYIRKYLNDNRVKALIEASVDINNRTFLMQECEKGNEDNVRVLIELGEDVNKVNDLGTTALMYAVKNCNNLNLIKMLIDAGANINETNKNGITAFTMAIFTKRSEDIIKTLIDAGADLNKREEDGGFTPLMIAILNDADIKVIKLLIDSGADINAKCDKKGGYTALEIAESFEREDVIDLIKSYQKNQCKVRLENVLENKKTFTRDI